MLTKKLLFIVTLISSISLMAAVEQVMSREQFNSIINSPRLSVVAFEASKTCKPCKIFLPQFHSLASQNPGVAFAVVDTDQQCGLSIAGEHDVSMVPTTLFFRNGKQVAAVAEGEFIDGVRNMLNHHKK